MIKPTDTIIVILDFNIQITCLIEILPLSIEIVKNLHNL